MSSCWLSCWLCSCWPCLVAYVFFLTMSCWLCLPVGHVLLVRSSSGSGTHPSHWRRIPWQGSRTVHQSGLCECWTLRHSGWNSGYWPRLMTAEIDRSESNISLKSALQKGRQGDQERHREKEQQNRCFVNVLITTTTTHKKRKCPVCLCCKKSENNSKYSILKKDLFQPWKLVTVNETGVNT